MWSTKTATSHYPFERFCYHVNTVFPVDTMLVNKDRTQWSCSLCPEMKPVVVSEQTKFHRQNCLKHFRSASHCKAAEVHTRAGTAVNQFVSQQKEQHIFETELSRAVVDDALISCAKKSLSFTSVPVVLDVVARALNSCRGKKALSVDELMKIRKVSPRGATMIARLQAVTSTVNTRAGSRSVCRRGRRAVTKRILELANQTLTKKVEHLLSCPYLSLTADESDTFSFSAPMAVALSGCSSTFEWANLFIGQECVADDKTGPGLYKKLRVILDGAHPDLWKLIIFSCFDGASAMRSTPMYAGLDTNPTGTSLVAMIKTLGQKELFGSQHGLCHLFNLAQKGSMKRCGEWVWQWMDHVKCIFRWFSKSPSRKSALKQLHKEMELLQEVVTWRMCYPKYFCPTRWVGISRCLKSILVAAPLLEEYADSLVRNGFRPDRSPIVLPDQAEFARLDEDDEDAVEDDERFHADDFHVWGEEYWDLPITIPNLDIDVLDEDDRLDLDCNGRASVWKDLEPSTNRKTHCNIISERCGLTAQMFGIDAIMLDALTPYKVLVERLQTQVVPIGHRVRFWISQCFKQLNSAFLSDDPSYGPNFLSWRRRDDVSEELSKQVEVMGRRYVYEFLKDAKYRLRPYWKFILASETINPCGPGRLSPSSWDGVRDLCKRVNMTERKIEETIKDLKQQRCDAGEWRIKKERKCDSNLLQFHHE